MRYEISSIILICSFIIVTWAKHCTPCWDCCGSYLVDPKTRIAELVETFNEMRAGKDSEEIRSILRNDFICNLRVIEGGCHPDIFSDPVMLMGFKYTVFRDDDWIQVSKDGTVQATFWLGYVNRSLSPSKMAAKIVQKWISSKGTCNYLLKQENYTDYRCIRE